jgi:tetratricopeptide (TPR) repeat protein
MNDRNPYVGPRPFTSDEQALFFGREDEANELTSLILAHSVVVLCAASGSGKTSLLNAKIVPELLKQGCEVFSGGRVGGDLPKEVPAAKVKNIFVFNALITLIRQEEESTSAKSHERLAVVPPERFDASLAGTFAERLARGHQPVKRQKQADASETSDTDEGDSIPRVLIFDQFEEIFTKYQDRWDEREAFFDQLGTVFERDDNLRVVFAMREEHLANLHPYAWSLPEQLRTQFRIEGLREDAALLAIKEPIKSTPRSYGKGAAERLVENLLRSTDSSGEVTGRLEFVEPLHLQIVCRNLWQSLDSGVQEITSRMIRDLGDVDDALESYYDECIRETVRSQNVEEGQLRQWFSEKLTISGGGRGLVYQEQETTAGMANCVVEELDVKHHLIRPEMRGRSRWYELSHDRFVEPIRQSNEAWRSANDPVGVALEVEAGRWNSAARADYLLLRGSALRRAAFWLGHQTAGASQLVREFIQVSTNEKNASALRSERRTRRVYAAYAAGLLVIVGMLFFAYSATKRAGRQTEQLMTKMIATRFASRSIDEARNDEYELASLFSRQALVALQAKKLEPSSYVLPTLQRYLIPPAVIPISQASLVTVTEDGKKLAAALGGRRLELWQTNPPTKLRDWEADQDISDLEFLPDGSLLIGTGNKYKILESAGKVPVDSSAQFSPEEKVCRSGQLAAYKGPDKAIHVVEIRTGVEVGSVPDPENKPGALSALSAKGTRLGIATSDGTIRIWDVAAGAQVASTSLSNATIVAFAISPDGQKCAVLSSDKPLRIWGIAAGKPVLEEVPESIESKSVSSASIRFSSDSKKISIYGEDEDGEGSLQIWTLRSFEPIEDFKYGARVTPNRNLEIIAVTQPSQVVVYSLAPDVKAHPSGTSRRLTFEEYSEALGDLIPSLPEGAQIARQDGDVNKAAKKFEEALKIPGVNFDAKQAASQLAAEYFNAKGEKMALENGNIDEAKKYFQKAVSLNPELKIDPKKAESLAAQFKMWEAQTLGLNEGLVEPVEQAIQKALQLDPRASADPHTDAQQFAARHWLKQAQEIADSGAEVEKVERNLEKAAALDPTEEIEPHADAQRLVAGFWNKRARTLAAQTEKLDDVAEALKKAVAANPDLKFDPAVESKKLLSKTLEGKANLAKKNGDFKKAFDLLAQADMFDPGLKTRTNSWNALAWDALLAGEKVELALSAAEKAMAAAAGDPQLLAAAQDTRGLAKALSGDLPGALADFTNYLEHSTSDSPQIREKRRTWVEALRRGVNPFTSEVLTALRSE